MVGRNKSGWMWMGSMFGTRRGKVCVDGGGGDGCVLRGKEEGKEALTVDQLWGLAGSLGSNATIVASSPNEVSGGGLLSLSVGGKAAELRVIVLLLLLLVTETGLTFSVSLAWLVFSIVSFKSSQEGAIM